MYTSLLQQNWIPKVETLIWDLGPNLVSLLHHWQQQHLRHRVVFCDTSFLIYVTFSTNNALSAEKKKLHTKQITCCSNITKGMNVNSIEYNYNVSWHPDLVITVVLCALFSLNAFTESGSVFSSNTPYSLRQMCRPWSSVFVKSFIICKLWDRVEKWKDCEKKPLVLRQTNMSNVMYGCYLD